MMMFVGVVGFGSILSGNGRILCEKQGFGVKVSCKSARIQKVNGQKGGIGMSGGPTSYEEYMRQRNAGRYQGGTMKEVEEGLKGFIATGDLDFDGGDSGGGVVGDGNYDLEDQHNSSSFLREDGTNPGERKVESAMNARIASAGANYFGRSTGYAEEKIKQITEEDRKKNRLDEVRAQQLENWHNQRQIHSQRRGNEGTPAAPWQAAGYQSAAPSWQSPSRGWEPQSSSWDQPSTSSYGVPYGSRLEERLDGQAWGEAVVKPSDRITETYEIRCNVNSMHVTEISVPNQLNTFLPYRCQFTADSHPAFTASPETGTMERRSGEPVNVVVRFAPIELASNITATLVFETEEFKNVYKFIAST
eukprot:CAMPEP_0182443982 /NCGR_PEP_ID=MMETSP1172-20130603/2576_1 /TAXON_ID=708627 /ORGANISM="Timspurckia oligopyrenoides, Strain CCMP3278" /LENGTH=360 /DNA_ID=CAMNT_0024639427 /DNA_START=102 /DNA_END=1184 /DNA_ORIENTATION=-